METLKISLLTPVAIGTGAKLSPYGDFVLDEQQQKLFILNHEEIKKALTSREELLDKYVKGVADGMDNNRSTFELKNFITNRLNVSIQDVAKVVYSTSNKVVGKKQLNLIIKNAGYQPYIPGSSLKGAIKTALLYYWLTCQKEGQALLNVFLKEFYDKNKRKEYEAKIEEQLKKYTLQVNGNKLTISDSSVLESSSVKIYHTERLHLKVQGKSQVPQVWETIDRGNELTMKINPGTLDLDQIFKAINFFSLKANDRLFSQFDELGDNVDPGIYDKLFDVYQDIDNRLKQGETLLRLGFGKSYFFNSVGLAVVDFEGGKYFGSFLKAYGHKKFKNPNHFPITQLIEASVGMPLGWVKLEKS